MSRRAVPLFLALFAPCAVLLVPGTALAGGSVALPPLIAKGLDPKISNNITGLISSELDFCGQFDTVTEVPATAALNAACLSSVPCLGGIAKAAGADSVVAGSIGPGPDGVQVFLVLYEAKSNTIVRKKTFNAAADPSALADNSGRWIKELVTGVSPAQTKAEAVPSVTFETTDSDDEFSFDKPAAAPAKGGKSTAKAPPVKEPPKTRIDTKSTARALEDDEAAEPDEPEEDPDEAEEREMAAQRAKDEAAAKAKAQAKKAEVDAKAQAEAKARAKAQAEAEARAAAQARAEEEAREAAEVEAQAAEQARATALAKVKADRARAEAERLAQAEEDEDRARQAARDAAQAAKARAAKPAAKPAAEDDDIEFGAASAMIEVEEEEEEPIAPVRSASRGSTSTKSSGTKASRPPPVEVEPDEEDEIEPVEEEEEVVDEDRYADLDEDGPSGPASRTSRESSTRDSGSASRSSRESRDSSSRDSSSRDSGSRDSGSRDSSSRDSGSRDSSASRSSGSRDSSASRSSGSKYKDLDRGSSSARIKDNDKPGVALAGRVGYSRYFQYNFITYGAEVNIPVATSVGIIFGIEGFSTQREISDKVAARLAEEQGVASTEINRTPWNVILPINAGVVYKSSASNVRPYAGLDLTLTPYTPELDMAFGARLRAGADFMLAPAFGLNLNLSAGIISGAEFEQTESGVENFGLIPQISGGTVFQF